MNNHQVCISLICLLLISACNVVPTSKVVEIPGRSARTYYVVTYYDAEGRNFQKEMESLLADFDRTASMWVENSIISKINRNEYDVQPNNLFIHLFELSNEIYEQSNGAFDPTVGPLVNAWGFGFTDRMKVDQHVVDSLLPLVGFNRVKLEDGQVIKNDARIQFDFNAIAQGYSVDLVGEFLNEKGIKNFLIDIGGEVLAKGTKPNGELWKVGIENPKDNAQYGEGLKAIVTLKNRAMATSGNYRKFYEEDGVRYSHTIDPKTGYPVQHSILSVSVLADDCASADAWATTFMVLGFEKSMEILADNKSLEAYFIYSGIEGSMQTHFTGGFKDILLEEM
ncbi:MAG: FAD:protein FMN transferase [Bacteroidales bacterium]